LVRKITRVSYFVCEIRATNVGIVRQSYGERKGVPTALAVLLRHLAGLLLSSILHQSVRIPIPIVIVLVRGLGVPVKPLMFPSEPALLVALRAFGVIIPVSPGLGSQRLVSRLVFLGDLGTDAPMLPPAVMSKGQGSGQE
jgi:hypothetical protein